MPHQDGWGGAGAGHSLERQGDPLSSQEPAAPCPLDHHSHRPWSLCSHFLGLTFLTSKKRLNQFVLEGTMGTGVPQTSSNRSLDSQLYRPPAPIEVSSLAVRTGLPASFPWPLRAGLGSPKPQEVQREMEPLSPHLPARDSDDHRVRGARLPAQAEGSGRCEQEGAAE